MGTQLIIKEVSLFDTTKRRLPHDIEQQREYVDMMKNELVALAAYNGEKYYNDGEVVSLVDWAAQRVPELVAELTNASFKLRLMEIAQENPDDVEESC